MDLSSCKEVSLEEMLAARENRVTIQNKLIASYQAPVISFTLNIPGPVKVFDHIPDAFEEGVGNIEANLQQAGIPLLFKKCIRESTGYEAFFCADSSPSILKELMTRLEESSAIGRLYDIDIIRTDGSKVSREELGLPVRTCLLCNEPAHACSRSRRHSVKELIEKIGELLQQVSADSPGQIPIIKDEYFNS